MKRLAYSLIIVGALFTASILSRSNTVYVRVPQNDSDGVIAIQKLSGLVDANFLNREYYEVETISDLGPCFFVNYNKKYQTLLISNDPLSGWSYRFKSTPEQLKKIAEGGIPVSKLEKILTSTSQQEHRRLPTRSMDIISIF